MHLMYKIARFAGRVGQGNLQGYQARTGSGTGGVGKRTCAQVVGLGFASGARGRIGLDGGYRVAVISQQDAGAGVACVGNRCVDYEKTLLWRLQRKLHGVRQNNRCCGGCAT